MFADGIFREIGGGGYGQNLAMWGSSENPEAFGATASVARAASNGWYNGELNDFPSSDYGKDSPNMSNFEKWGHFSQLVWAETKKVGCHTHFCEPGTMSGMGSWYTVCNYYPAGMLFSLEFHIACLANIFSRQHGRRLRQECLASPGRSHREGGLRVNPTPT